MSDFSPLVLEVFDKNLAPMDWVGAPLDVSATIRYNAASSLEFSVDADDEQVEILNAPGSRLRVWYIPDERAPDERVFLISGRIEVRDGDSTGAQTRTYTVHDDWHVAMSLEGWPNPAGTIAQQGDEGAYYTPPTGPAETVLKQIVAANAPRQLPALTVVPTQGRGSNITASVRFHPIEDRLFPAVDQAGVGVTVRQVGSGIVLDCYTPTVEDVVLTEESGIVTDGSFRISAPTATRAVILGGGVGTARVTRQVIDTAAETLWGFREEIVIDARDTTSTAVMDARGWQALKENAATSSVTAGLSETDDWKFGVAFNLGDLVPIQLNGAPPITDRVREVGFKWTPDNGLEVTPRVGNVENSPVATIGAAIRRIATTQRDQKVSL